MRRLTWLATQLAAAPRSLACWTTVLPVALLSLDGTRALRARARAIERRRRARRPARPRQPGLAWATAAGRARLLARPADADCQHGPDVVPALGRPVPGAAAPRPPPAVRLAREDEPRHPAQTRPLPGSAALGALAWPGAVPGRPTRAQARPPCPRVAPGWMAWPHAEAARRTPAHARSPRQPTASRAPALMHPPPARPAPAQPRPDWHQQDGYPVAVAGPMPGQARS
jgi:hypothetical protein